MRPITIYTAHCQGNKYNTRYPTKRVITSAEELKEAAKYDQVFAEYNGFHRSIDDFICSDCLPFDCDNSHSDDEADWKTAEDMQYTSARTAADAGGGAEISISWLSGQRRPASCRKTKNQTGYYPPGFTNIPFGAGRCGMVLLSSSAAACTGPVCERRKKQ